MAGKILCLLLMTISALVLLWLYAENKEKNKKDAVKVLVITGVLGLVICITENENQSLVKHGKLQKNQPGEEAQNHELTLNAEGVLEDYTYTVEVEAQKLRGKELDQLFESAIKEAEKAFLGENISLEQIERDVSLPKKLQEGQIRVKWESDPQGYIDSEGMLHTEKVSEEGSFVMISLTMFYFDEVREYSFGCLVFPKKLNKMERLFADLEEYLELEKEKSRNKQIFQLPLQINGIKINWSLKSENTYRIIILVGIAASVAVYIQQGMKEQKKEQDRKSQLLRQYPDMVSKLSLLLGAGMTFSGAWERIVLNYQHQIQQHQTEQAEAYEQMLLSYREMQDGVGERKVYERFGERCGTPQYRKLSMLIVQNLRKGSSGLRQILDKEVEDAFLLRKNMAKKAGEEAGTKILIPMMIMLCIVMVIILVPAFLTFRI